MGIVLRGQDRLTGRMVALKTVRGHRRSDAASIRREIVALGQMSHPGVIRLVDHGTWNGKPWMALELLDGRTVCDEIDLLWRKGPEGLFQAQHGRCRSDDLPTMPSHIRTARRAGPHPRERRPAWRPRAACTTWPPSRKTSAPRWITSTASGWCTATSSRRTSSSARMGG